MLTRNRGGGTQLDHVTLVVKDLEASRRFYVDILGMREVPRPAFSFAGLWFQAGATQIHLILKHEKSSPAGLPDAPPQAGAGRVFHFAFEVPNFEEAQRRLAAAGVRSEGPACVPTAVINSGVTIPTAISSSCFRGRAVRRD